jgi:hypothetical protein
MHMGMQVFFAEAIERLPSGIEEDLGIGFDFGAYPSVAAMQQNDADTFTIEWLFVTALLFLFL